VCDAVLRVAAWPRTVDAHRVVHRYGVAPRPQGGLPVGCPLPLEGAGLVVGFAGRPTVPSCPVELHPCCKLLITPVFQYFSGVEIDLHGWCLSCAPRASQGVKSFNGLFPYSGTPFTGEDMEEGSPVVNPGTTPPPRPCESASEKKQKAFPSKMFLPGLTGEVEVAGL
jgi:hypothetical protein